MGKNIPNTVLMAIVKNDCRDYIDRREYGSCRDWQKNGNIENIETVKNDGNIGTVGKKRRYQKYRQNISQIVALTTSHHSILLLNILGFNKVEK